MENILPIILGVVCIVIGIANCKGNISMLHSYHRKCVTEENRLPFGRLVGTGMIIIGVSIMLAGILFHLATYLQQKVYYIAGNTVLIVGFVVGLGIIFYAMFKYNKGIF